MPAKKKVATRRCKFENAHVPASEFETIGGTLIHRPPGGDPPHRPDGFTVEIVDGVVTLVVAKDEVAVVSDAFEGDRG